jgi:uncharacterized membrane protein (DUF2068 family)
MSAAPSANPERMPPALPVTATNPAGKRRGRPFGLLAIIVIQLLTMLVSGLLILALVAAIALATTTVDTQVVAQLQSLNLDLSPLDLVTLLLTFVVNGVCAVGLWQRQRWAWFLTMLQLGFFMLTDLYSYFTNSPVQTYAWSMVLNVAMVFYLNQREVQALFLTKDERQHL